MIAEAGSGPCVHKVLCGYHDEGFLGWVVDAKHVRIDGE